MKIVFFILLFLVLAISAYFFYLSKTDPAPNTGLMSGKLRPCSEKPNCVSSETTGEKYIEPFKSESSMDELWQAAQDVVVAQGGVIQSSTADHVWATFQSKLFKFTDDVELRRDDEAGVVQVRSGSRSGTSDLGVNRKRVEAIRAAIK